MSQPIVDDSAEWISEWDYARIPPSSSSTAKMATKRRPPSAGFAPTSHLYTAASTPSHHHGHHHSHHGDYNYPYGQAHSHSQSHIYNRQTPYSAAVQSAPLHNADDDMMVVDDEGHEGHEGPNGHHYDQHYDQHNHQHSHQHHNQYNPSHNPQHRSQHQHHPHYDQHRYSKQTHNAAHHKDHPSIYRTDETNQQNASPPNSMTMSWSRMNSTSKRSSSSAPTAPPAKQPNGVANDDRMMDDSQTDSTAALTQTASLDDGSSFLLSEDTTDCEYTDYHEDDIHHQHAHSNYGPHEHDGLDSHNNHTDVTVLADADDVSIPHNGQHGSDNQNDDANPFIMMMDEDEGLLSPILDEINTFDPASGLRRLSSHGVGASTAAAAARGTVSSRPNHDGHHHHGGSQDDMISHLDDQQHLEASTTIDTLLMNLVDTSDHNSHTTDGDNDSSQQDSAPMMAFADTPDSDSGFLFHPMPTCETPVLSNDGTHHGAIPPTASASTPSYHAAAAAVAVAAVPLRRKPHSRPVPYISGSSGHGSHDHLQQQSQQQQQHRHQGALSPRGQSKRSPARHAAKGSTVSSSSASYQKLKQSAHQRHHPKSSAAVAAAAAAAGRHFADRHSGKYYRPKVTRTATSKKRQHYEGMLRKLTESMKRSQSTRKSLELVTEEIKDYTRKANLKRVLNSIEASSRQIDSHLITKRPSKKSTHSKGASR